MNAGERAELKFIAILGCYVGANINLNGNLIDLQRLEIPYGSGRLNIPAYSPEITPELIAYMSDLELVAFCRRYNIQKAGPMSKADLYINGTGYSIKYTGESPPAIVNHTPRTGWEFAALTKHVSITDLDRLIDDYWNKRISGVITEDVANTHPASPFGNHIGILLPFLEYFSFEGTGSRISTHPATCVIEFSDPRNMRTWKLLSQAAFITHVWPRLVFSVRSKGMPDNINSNRITPSKRTSILKWSKIRDGLLKGSLHVRVR